MSKKQKRQYDFLITTWLMMLMLMLSSVGNAWFDTSASGRNNLTISNASATTFNFPFLIKQNFTGFTSSCIDYSVINSSDNEKLFYTQENNTCSVGGNALIWAKVNSITTGSNNNVGWLYHNYTSPFDNSTQYGVFDSSIYKYVFHMDRLEVNQTNSVAGLNSSRLPNGYFGGNATNGQFGYAIGLIGNDTATTGSGVIVNNGWSGFNRENVTIEIWFNATVNNARTLFGFNAGSCELGINTGQAGGNTVRFYAINPSNVIFDNLGGGVSFTTGTWNYFAFAYDGTTAYIYRDGTLIQQYGASGNKSLCTNTMTFAIGSGGSGGLSGFMGLVDEVRVSPFNLSKSYIKSVWDNRNGATIGATETFSFSISVFDPANTTYSIPNVNLNVSSPQPMDKWWYSLNGGSNTFFTPNTTITGISGSNNLRVYGNTTTGTTATQHVNFTINDPSPTISIIDPANTTYVITNITLRTSYTDNDPSSFWYILNGGSNITFNQNTTFIGTTGTNVLNVYINDTIGNIANASVSFTINTTMPTPTPTTTAPTDPNVLLFLVVLFLVVVGIMYLAR